MLGQNGMYYHRLLLQRLRHLLLRIMHRLLLIWCVYLMYLGLGGHDRLQGFHLLYRCKNEKKDFYECPGRECVDCPDQGKFSDFGPHLILRFWPTFNSQILDHI